MSVLPFAQLGIERDFRGHALSCATNAHAQLRLSREDDTLCIEVDAPYFGDPAPDSSAGPTDRLWEFEVCELFIADAADHYLEVELSPHGHHLVLQLAGVRHVVRSHLPIDYSVRIERDPATSGTGRVGRYHGRYHGLARVPWAYLPASAARVNAYLIHSVTSDPATSAASAARCYHAHAATGGEGEEGADFHRLERFVPTIFP